MKTVGDARTSEINAIPEPFLPNQLDVGLAFFVELLGAFHLLCSFITSTQKVSNLDRALDAPRKYSLVISNKLDYPVLPVCVVDARESNHKLGEYRDSMGLNALHRKHVSSSFPQLR